MSSAVANKDGTLVRHAAGTLALRSTMVGLEFICGIVLAQTFKVSGYGVYAFVISWVGLLAIPAAAGLDRLLIREVAHFRAQREWALLSGLLRWSFRLALGISVTIMGVGALVLYIAPLGLEAPTRQSLAIGLATVPLVAVARLRFGALQGFGRVLQGLIPETVIQPTAILMMVGSLYVLPFVPRSGVVAVAIHAVGVLLAFAAGAILLRRSLPAAPEAPTAAYRSRQWLNAALPMAWVLGMNVVLTHTDVVMLGVIDTTEAAGTYRVAAQLAALVALPLGAVNAALAPRIASAYAGGQMHELQSEVTRAARLALLFASPIVVGLAFFGNHILALFGPEFESARTSLNILAAAQALNAATGTAGYVLVMTRFERHAAALFGLSALMNVVMNLHLIPRFGPIGAAIASCIALLILNIGLAWGASRWVGIRTTPLGSSRQIDGTA